MSAKLRFSITLPGGKVAAGDQIVLNMALENSGDAECYVNTRFAVAPQIGDVRITIKSAGLELPFQLRVRLVPVKNSDFLLLKPCQRVVAGYGLSRGFRLDKPGDYEVTADYVSDQVPAVFKGMPVFKGQLTSPSATVRIS